DAEEGGLAGAVGAEKGDHLSVVDGEVDVEEHLELAVGEVDGPAGQHGEVFAPGLQRPDVFCLDDLVHHPVEVGVDEPRGAAYHQAGGDSGQGQRGNGAAGAVAALDATEEKEAAAAAHR